MSPWQRHVLPLTQCRATDLSCAHNPAPAAPKAQNHAGEQSRLSLDIHHQLNNERSGEQELIVARASTVLEPQKTGRSGLSEQAD